MNIIKKDNYYIVQSSKNKKKYYQVDLKNNECTCPHYKIRLKKTNESCKHIISVKSLLYNDSKDDFSKAKEFVAQNFEVDINDFLKKFSLGLLDELIEKEELIENKGKINLPK
ncbi:MAG: SWIM zinc finger family protein [Nanoarchaeota archaeon]